MATQHIYDHLMSDPGHPRTFCGRFTGERIKAALFAKDATCKQCRANAKARQDRMGGQARDDNATENAKEHGEGSINEEFGDRFMPALRGLSDYGERDQRWGVGWSGTLKVEDWRLERAGTEKRKGEGLTNEESLKADRDLAAHIIAAVFLAPNRCMTLANLCDRFPDVDDARIDVILDDLSDVIDVDEGRRWLYLSAAAGAEFDRAATAVCLRLAEEAIET